jgi:hypothetical protein
MELAPLTVLGKLKSRELITANTNNRHKNNRTLTVQWLKLFIIYYLASWLYDNISLCQIIMSNQIVYVLYLWFNNVGLRLQQASELDRMEVLLIRIFLSCCYLKINWRFLLSVFEWGKTYDMHFLYIIEFILFLCLGTAKPSLMSFYSFKDDWYYFNSFQAEGHIISER